ncbi:DUF6455 family protein [Pseudophaeobacter sp.]|uniref:DUF6455 family protein n=1 Tax=Pseudophaeobacter sp. TaxID=1971739 RepID=UPI0032998D3A
MGNTAPTIGVSQGKVAPRGLLGDFNRHFWQLRSVARVAGIDLGEAMREGQISESDYAAIVTRCRGAGCAQACAQWLANSSGAQREIPEFCVNRAELERLRTNR